MAKILLVEDQLDIRGQIEALLRFHRHVVDSAANLVEARHFLSLSRYDLLILDRGLPDGDSLSMLTALRNGGDGTLALILTGRSELADKLDGFSQGADDYLTKPFHLQELAARVDVLLKRRELRNVERLAIGPIMLDVSARRVFLDGREVFISRTDMQLLEFLMLNKDSMFTTEQLLNRVWSANSEATADAVKSSIKRLRQKLDPGCKFIHSKYGAGYMISADSSIG